MGFRISYVVAPTPPRTLVAALGFQIGVETDALPYDEWWVGTLKSNGMTVLWAEAEEFVKDAAEELAAASSEDRIIACRVNEDSQTSSAVCYYEGRVKWRVEWQGGEDATSENLVASGDLPAGFALAVEEFSMGISPDANVEKLFEVPMETAASATGFRHENDLMTRAFTHLFRITAGSSDDKPATKQGFLAKIFGR